MGNFVGLFLVSNLRATAEAEAEKDSFPIKKESFVSSLVQIWFYTRKNVNVFNKSLKFMI